jgi:uncharacterized protein YjiS (DUF1127 family)
VPDHFKRDIGLLDGHVLPGDVDEPRPWLPGADGPARQGTPGPKQETLRNLLCSQEVLLTHAPFPATTVDTPNVPQPMETIMSYVTCEQSLPNRFRTYPNKGLGRTFGVLGALIRRHIQRRELEDLLSRPDYLLKDVGITRDDLREELATALWRLKEQDWPQCVPAGPPEDGWLQFAFSGGKQEVQDHGRGACMIDGNGPATKDAVLVTMASRSKTQLWRLAVGAVFGLVGGLGAAMFALLVAGAGHGKNTAACIMIPRTMLYTLRGSGEWWFLPIAVGPYVLYGLALGYRLWLFMPIFAVHAILAGLAMHRFGAVS